MTRLALAILAALSLRLARRSPAWRPVAASLAALACIDLARLWTAPLGATRSQPWWGIDVALVALWPAAVGVGLLRGVRFGSVHKVRHDPEGLIVDDALTVDAWMWRSGGDDGPDYKIQHERSEVVHPPILPRLALLAALALVLGACRPSLHDVVLTDGQRLTSMLYLGALRALRWGPAGLWAEAIVGSLDVRRRPPAQPGIVAQPSPRPADGVAEDGRRFSHGAEGIDDRACDKVRRNDAKQATHTASYHAARACALVLAGCNVAGLLAGAWLVPPWEPPAWALAGPVTWAAYVACGVVMGWEAWRGR